jgi:hypothetical protein
MIDYSNLELKNLKFRDETPLRRLCFQCLNILAKLFGVPPLYAAGIKGRLVPLNLDLLGKLFGFKESKSSETLSIHGRRLILLLIIRFLLMMILYISLTVLAFLCVRSEYGQTLFDTLAPCSYKINDQSLASLKEDSAKSRVPSSVLEKLQSLTNQKITGMKTFQDTLTKTIGAAQTAKYGSKIREKTILPKSLKNYITYILIATLIGLMVFVTASLTFRVSSIILNRHFVLSECIYNGLGLLIDLIRNDVLIRSDRKRLLLRRIDYLAMTILLMPSVYASNNKPTQEWSRKHFRQVSLFIRERARWVIAPLDTTLTDLRRDFSELAAILIKGNYGEFSWQHPVEEQETSSLKWQRRLVNGLPRFLGLILPLILMGLYLLKPELFPFIKKDHQAMVTYIFLAWLLLSIDASLKLGIVAGLTKLAKGIKGLE